MIQKVSDCEYRFNGIERVYNFTNKSIVVERTDYPGKLRFKFYDPRGYSIYKGRVKVEMKAAIDRYKLNARVK